MADKLAEDSIEAEVIDLRSIRPFDDETIVESVRKTHRAVVVQEQWRWFSVASEVAAIIQEQAFDDLDAPVERVSGAEVPAPYARNLEVAAFPSEAADVIDAGLRRVLYLRRLGRTTVPTVIMPKMGDAMEEGTLLKWLKSEGDEVTEGDPIAEIETDKVTLEIEAQDEGTLTQLLAARARTVPVGEAIAFIQGEGEEVPERSEAGGGSRGRRGRR